MNMGPLVKYSVCLIILSSLYLNLDAQDVVGLASAPVGTYQFEGSSGEREFISSVGNAKVGIFRESQPKVAQPVKPPMRPPVKPKNPPPKKSPGVNSRQGGLIGGLIPGLLGGLLGGR